MQQHIVINATTWTSVWIAILAVILVAVLVWAFDGWLDRRQWRQANDEALERLWAETCPVCGRDRKVQHPITGQWLMLPPCDHVNYTRPYDHAKDGL